MTEKRDKIIMIRLTKDEHRALFRVAKELDKPVSTVARQIILRGIKYQPGVTLPGEPGELIDALSKLSVAGDDTPREESLKNFRNYLNYMQGQLDQLELEDAVRDSERDDENQTSRNLK